MKVLSVPSAGLRRNSLTTPVSRDTTSAGASLYTVRGTQVGGAKKLRQTMLSNLYLLPHLLGSPIDELDMWHGSSDAEPSYVECIPEEYFLLWTAAERESTC
jgi:hypothetical protein